MEAPPGRRGGGTEEGHGEEHEGKCEEDGVWAVVVAWGWGCVSEGCLSWVCFVVVVVFLSLSLFILREVDGERGGGGVKEGKKGVFLHVCMHALC